MWWVIGGIVIAAAALRWAAGRAGPDQSERVARAFAALHRRRRVPIAGAEEGPVLIRGQVSAGERLTAPFSRQPCVFYDVRITNLLAMGPSRENVRQAPPSTVLRRLREARSFFVTDETGTAEVAFEDPADVSFVVEASLSLQGRKLSAEAAIQDVLRGLWISDSGSLAVNEAAIFVGDEVTVVGTGTREVAPSGTSGGFRSPPMQLVVRGGPHEALAILKKKS